MNDETDLSDTSLPPAKRKLHFGLGLWRVQKFYKDWQNALTDKGAANIARENLGRRQMEKAARHLKVIEAAQGGEPLTVYYLTGKKFWYQTVFCAYSLAQQTGREVRPIVFDDGSLARNHIEAIKRIFPQAEIVSPADVLERLDERLPESRFPVLRNLRKNYVFMRKLTDVHGSAPGWKLYLDSDMLFFHRPAFLLEWLESPTKSVYMKDNHSAYGYDEKILTSLTKKPMLECVNAGISGLNSDQMDWDQLEFWCKSLIESDMVHHFLEQALQAMYFSVYPSRVAPEEDYLVLCYHEQLNKPNAVLHHYVGETKSWYFQFGWKNVLHRDTKNANQ